jgi:hypothetical protein
MTMTAHRLASLAKIVLSVTAPRTWRASSNLRIKVTVVPSEPAHGASGSLFIGKCGCSQVGFVSPR